MDNRTYECGTDAVNILKKYKSGDLSNDEAEEHLDSILNDLKKLESQVSDSASMYNDFIEFDVSNAIDTISGTDNEYTIADCINNLNDDLHSNFSWAGFLD